MRVHHRAIRLFAAAGALLLLFLAGGPPGPAAAASPPQTYIVVFAPGVATPQQLGGTGQRVVANLQGAGVMIVESSNPAALAALPGVSGVVLDKMRYRVPDEGVTTAADAAPQAGGCASTAASCGEQWDLDRIHVPAAWQVTQGSPTVKVAVLDTGLNSSHQEVGPNYDRAESQSFVQPTSYCPQDATTYASTEDFQGHGTWTATHIAGINGPVMSGIAPQTTLVNVRVLGACGFGFDSWIMRGMYYASSIGAAIESMSLGGYMCGNGVIGGSFYCDTPTDVGGDPILWQAYAQLVNYLLGRGTVVIAAAGNEHVQLDAMGQVINHGSLASCLLSPTPILAPNPCNDLYGLTETPGGIPGVVAVAATNRVTAAGAAGETKYGQFGVGDRDQLTYFSNYGARIDVSAPGGARNYNVPLFDCKSANCGRLDPSNPAATDNPGDFGAWGVDPLTGNPCNTCYMNVQGTSMATPQVAGVAALALAARPGGLSAGALVQVLRQSVSGFTDLNATPAVSGTNPASPTYLFDLDYGAPGIPNTMMGTGVIDAARAVQGGVPTPPGGTTWSPWTNRGGVLTDSPAAASLNGRVFAFVRGSDNALYVKSSADGATWTDWSSLGGILTDAPAAASFDNALYVFAKGSDNALYMMHSADGQTWSGWTRLGGILTAPPAAASANGTLYVFAKGSDSALYMMSSTDGATFSAWRNLGGILTAAPAAAGFDGQIWVFAKGSDNALYDNHSADGVTFSGWHSDGGVLTAAPAAASYTPIGGAETLYLFARGTDGALYERHTTDGATYTDWASLGGQLVGPPAAAGAGSRLYVVVRWIDNALWERHTLP
ncbi:MAG TPA: S8 family serine peptidase [Thermomicrobiales bacterium]|nr:S8 family serine peptidase [Thermomicrobiales bacterium]